MAFANVAIALKPGSASGVLPTTSAMQPAVATSSSAAPLAAPFTGKSREMRFFPARSLAGKAKPAKRDQQGMRMATGAETRRTRRTRSLTPAPTPAASESPGEVLDEYEEFIQYMERSDATLGELMERWDRPHPNDSDRRTRVVATVGPRTCSEKDLFRLALDGVNVFRLNMSHGSPEWHKAVIDTIKKINEAKNWNCAVLLDIGSLDTIRIGDITVDVPIEEGERFTLTVQHTMESQMDSRTTTLSYDGFISGCHTGDVIQLQSDTTDVLLKVTDRTSTDLICECTKGGVITSRMRVSSKGAGGYRMEAPDCIQFGIDNDVEFLALSFVRDRRIIDQVKAKIHDETNNTTKVVSVIAKIENREAMENINEIVEAADGIMVARGDLGAAIGSEEVPLAQEAIVQLCRDKGKPVIVSTHFLESMNLYPTPTRAEVTDISRAVRQEADAIMLTTETALGAYPFKAIEVLSTVSMRMEENLAQDREVHHMPSISTKEGNLWGIGEGRVIESVVVGATTIGNNCNAAAILVFTKTGGIVRLLSRRRPRCPIYAFGPSHQLCAQMNLLWGVQPFKIDFAEDDSEETVQTAMEVLLENGLVKYGDSVVCLFPGEDVMPEYCHQVQLRHLTPFAN
eukprot:tig00020537_g10241.t1